MQFRPLIVIFLIFVKRNIGNTLYCPYGKDAGCLALLNATPGGPAEGRIQQGEVSACPPSRAAQTRRTGILVFKGNCPYFIQHQASSIQYLPILT
jgi:hypothetical protein